MSTPSAASPSLSPAPSDVTFDSHPAYTRSGSSARVASRPGTRSETERMPVPRSAHSDAGPVGERGADHLILQFKGEEHLE